MFQVLSTRARKGVIVGDIKVQVCLYAFDLLYLNGQELLQEPLSARREVSETHVHEQALSLVQQFFDIFDSRHVLNLGNSGTLQLIYRKRGKVPVCNCYHLK